MIFNSLSWPRTEVAGDRGATARAGTNEIEVVDADGKTGGIATALARCRNSSRAIPAADRTRRRSDIRPISCGRRRAAPPVHSLLKASADTLENEFIRVKIDPQTGCMTSLFDKRSGTEALAPAETDTGGPKNFDLRQPAADLRRQAQAVGRVEYRCGLRETALGSGQGRRGQTRGERPAAGGDPRSRIIFRIRRLFATSSLYAGVPRVDVKMQTEWHEKHILLKVAFPVSAHSDKATYEIPFGSVERPTYAQHSRRTGAV